MCVCVCLGVFFCAGKRTNAEAIEANSKNTQNSGWYVTRPASFVRMDSVSLVLRSYSRYGIHFPSTNARWESAVWTKPNFTRDFAGDPFSFLVVYTGYRIC